MNEQIDRILANIRYATISTVDENGHAWAAPVWYVCDEHHNYYWWSSQNAQHSKNIQLHHDVYITIFDSTATEGEGVGLYIQAFAKEVSSEKLEEVINLYNSTTTQFKLSKKNTTGKAPTRLYEARQISIQINDGQYDDGFYEDIRRDIG